MRAYELIKETFFRRKYILFAHIIWLVLYVLFWWLFLPSETGSGRFILLFGGCFFALAISAGIFGDDISSGRICILITTPFWPGELYIYRLLGLSLQAAFHLLLAGIAIYFLQMQTDRYSTKHLVLWVFSSWLLFNTFAALSTSLSIVVGRAANTLLLFVVVITVYILSNILNIYWQQHLGTQIFNAILRYTCPPCSILNEFASGNYYEYNLTAGRYDLANSFFCVIHSLMLTLFYSAIGITMLTRRQFSCRAE